MGKQELDNLVKIGNLKAEPVSKKEFDGMIASARRSLKDAQNESIETDSKFILAYGAAHGFALAALRHQGYRSENRITVFQTLVHTPPYGQRGHTNLSEGTQRAKSGRVRGTHRHR